MTVNTYDRNSYSASHLKSTSPQLPSQRHPSKPQRLFPIEDLLGPVVLDLVLTPTSLAPASARNFLSPKEYPNPWLILTFFLLRPESASYPGSRLVTTGWLLPASFASLLSLRSPPPSRFLFNFCETETGVGKVGRKTGWTWKWISILLFSKSRK